MQEPEEGLALLQNVLSEQDDVDDIVSIYLLASILESQTPLPSEVSCLGSVNSLALVLT